jgi:hypothetical protein
MEAGGSMLDWLTRWYESQCDGEWEHAYGVAIDTLDNPGWSLKVDLTGTSLEGKTLDRIDHDMEHETGWWTCWTEANQFRAAGGPQQLASVISAFRDWADRVQ